MGVPFSAGGGCVSSGHALLWGALVPERGEWKCPLVGWVSGAEGDPFPRGVAQQHGGWLRPPLSPPGRARAPKPWVLVPKPFLCWEISFFRSPSCSLGPGQGASEHPSPLGEF